MTCDAAEEVGCCGCSADHAILLLQDTLCHAGTWRKLLVIYSSIVDDDASLQCAAHVTWARPHMPQSLLIVVSCRSLPLKAVPSIGLRPTSTELLAGMARSDRWADNCLHEYEANKSDARGPRSSLPGSLLASLSSHCAVN